MMAATTSVQSISLPQESIHRAGLCVRFSEGREASEFAKRSLDGKVVKLTCLTFGDVRDAYGRLLRRSRHFLPLLFPFYTPLSIR